VEDDQLLMLCKLLSVMEDNDDNHHHQPSFPVLSPVDPLKVLQNRTFSYI